MCSPCYGLPLLPLLLQFTFVAVANNSVLAASLLCTVSVGDVNDPPVLQIPHDFDVEQDAAYPGSLIGTLLASDEDVGDTVSFSMVTPTNATNYVVMDGFSGQLFIASPPGVSSASTVTFPAGGVSFSLALSDGRAGGQSTGTVSIRVIPANTPLFVGLGDAPPGGYGTAGGDYVYVTGAYLPGTPENVTMEYGNPSVPGWSYMAESCRVLSKTLLRCTTVPGVGSGLEVRVWLSGVRLAVAGQTNDVTSSISYNPPSLTGVGMVSQAAPGASLDSLTTTGGDVIQLTGTNFAPTCVGVVVSIGRWQAAALVQCNTTCVTAEVSPGAGANLTLRLHFIAGTTAGTAITTEYTAANLSYAAPVITGLAVSGVSIGTTSVMYLPTSGKRSDGSPATVTLYGSSFGPNTSSLTVTYGGGSYGLLFSGVGCVRDAGQSVMVCGIEAGMGSNLTWSVIVEGVASGPSPVSTSYPPPSLFAVTGVGSVEADTQGGQAVTLIGSDFGPRTLTTSMSLPLPDGSGSASDNSTSSLDSLPPLIHVTYGVSGWEYVAVGCAVSVSDGTQVRCMTGEGVGLGLVWRVWVAGQVSNVAGNTSYQRPIVSYFKGDGAIGAATTGLQVVRIFGRNFGPVGTAVSADYFSGVPATSAVFVPPAAHARPPEFDFLTAAQVEVFGVDTGAASFPGLNCSVVESHVLVECYTAGGGGVGLNWVVTVGGQRSQSPVTAYAPPNITSAILLVMAASSEGNGTAPPQSEGDDDGGGLTLLDTAGGEVVVLNGHNFGPGWPRSYITSVRLGPYTLAQRCNLTQPHTQLTCVTVPGVGTNWRWQVTVLSQAALSWGVFSYRPPSLVRSVPGAIPRAGGLASVWGNNIGADPSQTTVYVNDAPLPAFAIEVPHYALRFEVPPVSGGVSVAVRVEVAGQASNTFTLPVQPPVIENINVYDVSVMTPEERAGDVCARGTFIASPDGGGGGGGGGGSAAVQWVQMYDVIDVEGVNFGTDPLQVHVNLYVGDPTNSTSCDICLLSDTLVRCVTSASRTTLYSLGVEVSGQASPHPAEYWYERIMHKPVVAQVTPLSIPTTGDVLLLITGTYFKDRGVVLLSNGIDTLTCVTPPPGEVGDPAGLYYKKDGTEIQCLMPPGVGGGYELSITARGVTGVASGYIIAYNPPTIASITPSLLNTTGGEIVIEGSDFGAPMNMSGSDSSNTTLLSELLAHHNRSVTINDQPCVVSAWNHSVITCMVPPGCEKEVSVVVSVQGQTNSNDAAAAASGHSLLGYYAPVVMSIFPGNASTAGNTTLRLSGVNFCPPSYNLSVTFFRSLLTSYPCTVVEHTHTEVTCVTGEGAGAGLPVVVRTGVDGGSSDSDSGVGQVNGMDNARAVTFSYNPPVITGYLGSEDNGSFPVVGGFDLTLFGESFSTEASVEISRKPCVVKYNSHTTIICVAPGNFGRNHSVVVSSASQRGAAFPYFHYDGPVVTHVAPPSVDALSGSVIVVLGRNFGLQYTGGGGGGGVQDVVDGSSGSGQPIAIEFDSSSQYNCTAVLFVNDAQVHCTSPRMHLVGWSHLTVTTWNPSVANRSDVSQTSPRFPIYFACPEGYYGQPGEYCMVCPEHAYCPGGTSDPMALAGYYRIDRGSFESCRPPEACLGGNATGYDQCSRGYTDVRCAKCADRFYRLDLKCHRCPDMAWIFIVLFVLALMACLLLGVWLNKRRINLAALGIGVDFAQVVAMFTTFSFMWPSELKSVFTSISLFNFNIQIIAPECSIKWTYTTKFVSIAALPVLAAACTLGVALLIKAKNFVRQEWQRHRGRPLSPPTEVDALYGLMFASFYYLYLQVVKNALEPLTCKSVGGRSVMAAQPSVECSLANPVYARLHYWAVVCLCVYGVGIPATFTYVLLYYKNQIRTDQNLRKQALGNTAASNPFYFIRRRYQKLYSDFKPHRQYWRLLLLMRKLTLAGTTALFTEWPMFQAALSLAVMYGAYVLHTWTHPYMYRENVPQAFFDIINKEIAMNTLADRKLIQMAADAQRFVVKYVFNYNTLESVSITISIFILLAGMVFSSGAVSDGSWGYWLLVVLVAGVISLSILVMFCVIVFETYRAFRYADLYLRLSDYAESKMVKRVTAGGAGGRKTMQIGFSANFAGAGQGGGRPVSSLSPSSSSSKTMPGFHLGAVNPLTGRTEKSHLFLNPNGSPGGGGGAPGIGGVNPLAGTGMGSRTPLAMRVDDSGMTMNPLAMSRAARIQAAAASSAKSSAAAAASSSNVDGKGLPGSVDSGSGDCANNSFTSTLALARSMPARTAAGASAQRKLRSAVAAALATQPQGNSRDIGDGDGNSSVSGVRPRSSSSSSSSKVVPSRPVVASAIAGRTPRLTLQASSLSPMSSSTTAMSTPSNSHRMSARLLSPSGTSSTAAGGAAAQKDAMLAGENPMFAFRNKLAPMHTAPLEGSSSSSASSPAARVRVQRQPQPQMDVQVSSVGDVFDNGGSGGAGMLMMGSPASTGVGGVGMTSAAKALMAGRRPVSVRGSNSSSASMRSGGGGGGGSALASPLLKLSSSSIHKAASGRLRPRSSSSTHDASDNDAHAASPKAVSPLSASTHRKHGRARP